MVHKKRELDALYVTEKAKEALNKTFNELTIFMKAMQENEELQQSDAALLTKLENAITLAETIQKKNTEESLLFPEELNHLANELEKMSLAFNEKKFVNKNGNLLRGMSSLFPGGRQSQAQHEDKQLTQIHIRVMKALEILKENVKIVLREAKGHEVTAWEKLLNSCEHFAAISKNKILNLVVKARH